ncbi:KH domain-containing protein HEN4-like isoform X2 [Silene latifolia]|uniref:KH domain-containing protein HEN4-like isoform X2 n=1 Tax=Silene latifolia TaxID=37657 RepID=UPI003D77675D
MPKNKEVRQIQEKENQVQFRLVCNSHIVGGLIGSNGTVIKYLEQSTSSKISVNAFGPAGSDRIVHVVGDHSLTRTILLDGVEIKVSPAQDALVRVFDRMLEVDAEEGGGGGVVKCRLVVGPSMVGAVFGKAGKRINNICRETNAYIKVRPLASPPPGSSDSDQLVQITGGSIPVKKALVVISRFLQQKAIEIQRGAPEATSSQFLDRSMKMDTRNAHVDNTANGGVVAKVVFKLICPYHSAGGVIGYKGKKVKMIEEETKAAIFFSAADTGCERVVTISAFENRESQYSIAQNATVRVFNELVSSEEGNTVTARLLIPPYQADWLSDGEVSVMSTIHNANSATLKVVKLDNLPAGATVDEKVLQIDGDYPNVQIALFQVTWVLRERVFNASLPKDSLPLLPHNLFNKLSQGNKISSVTSKMHECKVSTNTNGSIPPMLPHSQFSAGSSLTTRTGSAGNSATVNDGFDFGSGKKSFTVTNTKVEIAVRKDVFSAVFGEDGSNLHRLRVISNAKVEVRDPSSTGNDGMVIISGTRDQTLVAQSLLQAFLMSA